MCGGRGQCEQPCTNYTRLKFMHRLDIMVSTISIVLYSTIKKKWWQRRKAAEVTKSIHLANVIIESLYLVTHIDTSTHIVDKYILSHTHTPEIIYSQAIWCWTKHEMVITPLLKTPLCHLLFFGFFQP